MSVKWSLVFCLLSWEVWSQELIPMGTWRSHFNYEQTNLVTQTKTKIFAATHSGLLLYDKEDQSISKLSKIDGLSAVGITSLAYDESIELLAVGYQNGQLDILSAEGIRNIPVLFNSSITESKSIRQIVFYQNLLYMATDFGMLVLDPQQGRVLEAYKNLGPNGEVIAVRGAEIWNDKLYLATTAGLMAGSLYSEINLQDFNNWERFADEQIDGLDFRGVVALGQELYAISAEQIFFSQGQNWQQIDLLLQAEEAIIGLKNGIDQLFLLTNQRAMTVQKMGQIEIFELPSGTAINDIIQMAPSLFWLADRFKGLTKLENASAEHFVINGPASDIAGIKILSDRVYAFPALEDDIRVPLTNGAGFSIFENGHWNTYSPSDLNGFTNLTDIVINNGETFLASLGDGILTQSNGLVFNESNSPLDAYTSGIHNTLVSGIAQDEEDNLWVANFGNYSLLKWNGDQEWETFDFPFGAAEQPVSIAYDGQNQLWMRLGLDFGQGLMGFDITTGESRYITSSSTLLPSNQVNDIAFGKDYEIWIATDKGLAYFPYSFGVVADLTINVSLPVYEGSFLFQDKKVSALTVDDGNRLWVGTQDGLWLFDESISQEIAYFNSTNSPLPSNTILDLAWHPASGELYIVTDQGMVSYRTNASKGATEHRQVSIFPNPVLPNFDGWVGLSGLARDVRIKIAGISGKLIREIDAAGGGASWDLKDYRGHRVGAGVYLIFSASSDGSETFVGKIAVID